MIHELVRDGRATPEAGARLIELRQSVRYRQRRREIKRHPGWRVAAFLAVIVMAILGIRREQA